VAYEADVYGARVKVREVGLVILWTALTIGIYAIVWYYRINRELRDFGRAYRDRAFERGSDRLCLGGHSRSSSHRPRDRFVLANDRAHTSGTADRRRRTHQRVGDLHLLRRIDRSHPARTRNPGLRSKRPQCRMATLPTGSRSGSSAARADAVPAAHTTGDSTDGCGGSSAGPPACANVTGRGDRGLTTSGRRRDDHRSTTHQAGGGDASRYAAAGVV
jgi:hypothetical protein